MTDTTHTQLQVDQLLLVQVVELLLKVDSLVHYSEEPLQGRGGVDPALKTKAQSIDLE
jgi:hypothetical protein